MSSHDEVDVEIDVVSSPDPSGANTSDDEAPSYPKRSKLSPPIISNAAVTLAASLLTTTANLTPSTLQNLQNHSAHLINNQYHSHISNGLLNSNKENHISECGRLSPPCTPETNNNNFNLKFSPSTTTPNTGFTSFSISSILSRQDSPNSKKMIAPVPSFPINGSQDAAMISR